MNRKNPFLLIALGISTLWVATFAQAQESPEKEFEATIRKVIDVLHSDEGTSDLVAKREKVLSILNTSFSFDIIIRRAFGRNWNELNEDQQKSVTALVTDLLINAYTRELKNGPKPEIKFLKTQVLAKGEKIEIPTTVSYKGSQVAVNYRLANIKNRGWQVYDVLVEGVSLVGNYKEQFDSHFQTKSAADLIKTLKEKLDNFDK